ncbi:hypothetical protein [Mycoplasma phocoeninasale]|uniref:hypothetical protein n=1 Tax=Mycoplasma phocoeninasale TaxID=2726117 RepID=UPI001967B9F9|nr:hypothetical protein [Mycoplasma phocoeninasale]MBN0970641.1 hypothetical protein [Mycoplasma phocoeninasale]
MKKNLKWLVIMPISVFSLPMIAAACENKNQKMEIPPKQDDPQNPPAKPTPPKDMNPPQKNPMNPEKPGDMTPPTPPQKNPMNPEKPGDMTPPTPPQKNPMNPEKPGDMTPPTPPQKNPMPPEKPNEESMTEKDENLNNINEEILYLNLLFFHRNKILENHNEFVDNILNNLISRNKISQDIANNAKLFIKDLKNARKNNNLDKFVAGTEYLNSIIGMGIYAAYLNYIDEKYSDFLKEFNGLKLNNKFKVFNKYWKKIRENNNKKINYMFLLFGEFIITFDESKIDDPEYKNILDLIKKAIDNKTDLSEKEVQQIDIITKKQM